LNFLPLLKLARGVPLVANVIEDGRPLALLVLRNTKDWYEILRENSAVTDGGQIIELLERAIPEP